MLPLAKFLNYLFKIDHKKRRIILVLLDYLIIIFSQYICFLFLNIKTDYDTILSLYLLTTNLTLIIYFVSNQYKGLTKYLGSQEVYKLFLRNILIIFFINIFINIFKIYKPSLNYWISYLFVSTFLISGVKFLARDILKSNFFNRNNNRDSYQRKKVVIYGAGEAGIQLLTSLTVSNKYKVKFFVDDSKFLQKRSIKGLPIFDPSHIQLNKEDIDLILLAMPSESLEKRRKIIKKINMIGLKIMQIPSIEELSSGKVNIDKLRELKIEDLLSREPIIGQKELIKKSINQCNLCITGGGGSIGSEICREICKFEPNNLIIIERSEPSIYKIEKEISEILKKKKENKTNLICILADCSEENLMKNIFEKYNIDIIYHSAAYKHVPLVEKNPISGIFNNIKSTFVITRLAARYNVKKFILISSDKAVRPTNIMGATKRLSEQIIQCLAKEYSKDNYTKFSAVRFGNVLGSSGSVVPLFEKQIRAGGPITLTHEEIIRYFMTINEAAQLVLQASSFSMGGEIFLLEMGEPILIKDLAIKMIRNSGLSVKDKNNQNGEIEILITGLRPGEKLYEELLIDGKSQPTSCPGIYYAKEEHIKSKLLWENLEKLFDALSNNDLEKSLKLLKDTVPEWEKKNNLRKT